MSRPRSSSRMVMHRQKSRTIREIRNRTVRARMSRIGKIVKIRNRRVRIRKTVRGIRQKQSDRKKEKEWNTDGQ